MDLIAAAYGEDSDDFDDSDPWSFSRVSTKRTLNDTDGRPLKRLAKLPPPRLSSITSDDSFVDDPALHGDRIRSFPHERGNWATFVHLPWPVTEEFLFYVQTLCQQFEKLGIGLETFEEFHVSLTKTVVLRHHWIEGFVASVRKQVDDIKRFPLYLSHLEVYINEEKTRTFLALKVVDTSNNLDVLVKRLDHCMKEYQLPEFYEDPAHHVSVAWCLGDRKKEMESIIASKTTTLEWPTEIDQNYCTVIDEVRCKVSQMTFTCHLKS